MATQRYGDGYKMNHRYDSMNGQSVSYHEGHERHVTDVHPTSSTYKSHSKSHFSGDMVEHTDAVSEFSDQSQKSIGEKHREALADMFERKIQKLRKDDLVSSPVETQSSQRSRRIQSNGGMNGHEYESHNGSSKSREVTRTAHHLSRHSMSHDRLSNDTIPGIGDTYRSGSTDQLHVWNKTQDLGRSYSPYKSNGVQEISKEKAVSYNSISDRNYRPDRPRSGHTLKSEQTLASSNGNRTALNGFQNYRLNRSSDAILGPRSGLLKSGLTNGHNYTGRENGLGTKPPTNQQSDASGISGKKGVDRTFAVEGGLSKRIPGEGSSSSDNQRNLSAPCDEDIHRMQDMEDTILSLRRLLNDREREIDELKMAQQDLQSQLNQQRSGAATDETYKNEKRVKELIMEKECLTTELRRMREEMGRQGSGAATASLEGDKPVSHIDNYQPNNPLALQRKIQDLESQIEDLTEVNESALAQYNLLEQQHKELMEEHCSLSSPSISLLQQQNKELQQQVMELRKLRSVMGKAGTMDDLEYMQAEVGNLRKDLRTLRDKNHQLTQDNIRLTEYIRDVEIGRPPHNNGLSEQNDSVAVKFRQERDAALSEIAFYKERLLKQEPKEQTPSEQKLSSNPYLTHPRTDKNTRTEFPEGGSVDHQRSLSHYGTLNSRSALDHADWSPYGRAEDDLIDDVVDELTLSSSHFQSSHGQGLYQVYPNKHELNGDLRGRLATDDLHTEGHYGTLAYTPSHNEPELSNLDSRIPKRRDSLNSNSTEFLMNELSQHLQLQASHTRDGELSELFQNPAGIGDTTIDLANRTVEIGPFELMDRPVNSKAIVTQQNKHNASASHNVNDLTPLLQGKVPFAPRNPTDINLGDVVKFCRQGGKISRGLVKYVGHLPGKNDVYLGVELEHEIGKHDGLYEGQRYFQCKSNRGVFVAFSKVVMVWGAT